MKKIFLLLLILSFTNAFSQGKKTTLSKQKPVEITPEIDYFAFVGVFTNKLTSELLVKTPTKAKRAMYAKIDNDF